MKVAMTILDQLGGRRFVAMTGSKGFIDLGDGLSFQLSRNKTKAKYMRIKLTAADTYNLEFISFNGRTGKMIIRDSVEGVYADMLRSVFERKTGLITSL